MKDNTGAAGPQVKTCGGCGIAKEIDAFHACKRGKFGVKSTCKACHLSRYSTGNGYRTPTEIKRRQEREARLAALPPVFLDGGLRICVQCSEAKPTDSFSDGRAKCKPCVHVSRSALSRAQRAESRRVKYEARRLACDAPTKSESQCTRCREVKPSSEFGRHIMRVGGLQSHCLACSRQGIRIYKHANPGKRHAYQDKRSEIASARADGTMTQEAVGALFASAPVCCPYCLVEFDGGKRRKSLDHVIPLHKGGLHSIHNALICCLDCNTRKGAKELNVWLAQIKRKRDISALQADLSAMLDRLGMGAAGLVALTA